jgi:phage-related protein
MANENVIGLAMNLDVTDLKAGIQEVSKIVKKSKDDFNNATAGMDKWTASSSGLSAKLTQLNTQLDAQKKAVSGYQAEIERVSKLEGDHSVELETLQSRLAKAQAEVKKTESSINKYSDSLGDVVKEEKKAESASGKLSKKINEQENTLSDLNDEYRNAVLTYGKNSKQAKALGKEIDDLSKDLEENKQAYNDAEKSAKEYGEKSKSLAGIGSAVGNGLKAIGASVAAIGGAFLATAESTRELRNNMSKLETSFTQAGLSAQDAENTYKNLYAVVGDEGNATKASTMIAQLATGQEDLSKWTEICTGVYATFGDSLPIDGLAEASNETVKTGALTGKLGNALKWAGVSEEKFQEQLDACSSETERQALITDTLTGVYGEASKQFKETNKDVINSNKSQAELSDTIAELGAIAEPIMTDLRKMATKLLKSLTPFIKLIGKGLTDALNGTAGAGEKLASGLTGVLSSLISTVTNMLPSIIDTIANLIPQIITALLGQLPKLITTATSMIVNVVNAITTTLPQIISAIVAVIPQIIQSLISAIPQMLEAGIQLLMAIVDALPTIITAILEALPSLIESTINALIDAIPLLLDGAIKLFMAIVDAIPIILQSLIKSLPTIITAVVNGLVKAIPVILDGAIQLFLAIIDAIPILIETLIPEIPNIITAIVEALIKAIPQIIQGAIQLFFGIIEAIPEIIKALIENMPQIIKAIVKGLVEGIPAIASAGLDLIKGLWQGIKDAGAWLLDKIKGFGESILGGIKDFFGIHSPSTVMAGVGKNLDEGLAQGIEDNVSYVDDAMESMGKSVLSDVADLKKDLEKQKLNEALLSFGGKVENPFDGWSLDKINAESKALKSELENINTALIDNGVTTEQWATSSEKINDRAKILHDRYEAQTKQIDLLNAKLTALGKTGTERQVTLITAEIDAMKKSLGQTISESEKLNVELSKTGTSDNSEAKFKNRADKIGKVGAKIASGFSNIASGVLSYTNQLAENQTTALENELAEFTSIKDAELKLAEENYNSELEALTEQNEAGALSDEEYANKKAELETALAEQTAQIELQKQLAEEETLRKKNEIAEKQFKAQKANDLANAIIQGAIAIVKGFAELGPSGGAVNAIAQGAITGLQIATISQQQYAPMLATGGITTGATNAIIGEDGQEAVLPLENNTGWMDTLAEKLNAIMQKDFTGGLQSSYATTNVVNNYYQTINSPETLSRRDIYRDTKNLLALKGV